MKNNSKFKKSRIVVPALALAVLTTTAAATSTVAWFSANNKVTASGMSFHATADSNLLIAKDDATGDASFTTSIDLGSTVKEVVPVSTVDAKSFFYTNNAKGDGSASTANYSTVTNGMINTSSYAYADFHFQLKATNNGESSSEIKVTTLNLLYGSAQETAIRAWRVAFLVDEMDGFSKPADLYDSKNTHNMITPDNYELKGIYTLTGATNFSFEKAVASTTELGTVTYNSATALGSVNTGSTKYYDVVARVWLEGEDTTCTNNDFKAKTDNWSLNMAFEMGTNTAAVTEIGSVAAGCLMFESILRRQA